MVARYYDGNVGRFISQDPWEGDLTNPQTLNKYSYVMNNPLKYIDPLGMRTHTEHEVEVAMKIYSVYTSEIDNGNNQTADTLRIAYNTYNKTIRDLPKGGDPQSFTILNDAVFKWHDNQMGYTDWSRGAEIDGGYYSDSDVGDYKCNFFVGKTLYDALGITPRHSWWGKNPPLARDWVNNDVEGFSSVDSPSYGDVISFNLDGSTDHAGFYFGNNLYISVTDSGRNGSIEDGVIIKEIPYNSFSSDQINYNRLTE